MVVRESSKGNRTFKSHSVNYGLDISFKTKKDRYFIRASGPVDELDTKDESPPTKWKQIYVDKKCKVWVGRATRDTDFTANGENIFIMKFRDGRKLRIYQNDFTRERITEIQKAVKQYTNLR